MYSKQVSSSDLFFAKEAELLSQLNNREQDKVKKIKALHDHYLEGSRSLNKRISAYASFGLWKLYKNDQAGGILYPAKGFFYQQAQLGFINDAREFGHQEALSLTEQDIVNELTIVSARKKLNYDNKL